MRGDDIGDEGDRKASGIPGSARASTLRLRVPIGPIDRRIKRDTSEIVPTGFVNSETIEQTARRLYFNFDENLEAASRWVFDRMKGLDEGGQSYKRWQQVFVLLRRWARGVRDGDKRRKQYSTMKISRTYLK